VLEGNVRAASRLMRLIEDRTPEAQHELKAIYPHTGRTFAVGITGAPGAGKSTLTSKLIALLRQQGKTVGVLAVDPSSPFTGGALLGDRIRMQEHAADPGVFIRSLATRGHLGGLSRATADCLLVMDALGRDVTLIETVGVGQDEIEIARLAHTTLLVLVPGLGDDIQAIKAGILEVADLFAVNKSDLDGSDRLVRELRFMMELRHATLPRREPNAAPPPEEWEPPIVKCVAARNEGVDALWAGVEQHRDFLKRSGQLAQRERARATLHFLTLLREQLLEGALTLLEQERGRLEDVAAQLAERKADPYTLAEHLVRELRH
jgi:LAO/AO transport system kinase